MGIEISINLTGIDSPISDKQQEPMPNDPSLLNNRIRISLKHLYQQTDSCKQQFVKLKRTLYISRQLSPEITVHCGLGCNNFSFDFLGYRCSSSSPTFLLRKTGFHTSCFVSCVVLLKEGKKKKTII